MRYSVFGLGDSSYLKYNFPAKKLQKRLAQLGGEALCALGLGDDQHSQGLAYCTSWLTIRYEYGLVAWLQDVWMNLSESGIVFHKHDGIPKASHTITFDADSQDEMDHSAILPDARMFHGSVVQNERVTSTSHFQDVRSIKIKIDDSTTPFMYNAGDILVIKPYNDPLEVQAFISHLGYDAIADTPLTLHSIYSGEISSSEVNQPKRTLREFLTENLDIFSPVKRYTLALLSHLTTDAVHSSKLLELSTTEHTDDFLSYAYKPRRTFFEIVQDFPSLEIPVEYLFDLVGAIKVRSFSIASACEVDRNVVEVCVAIVEYKSGLRKKRVGICTRWMSGWKVDDRVEFTIQKGTMECVDTDTPVILIGPGTGIAPLRSFLLKRISKDLFKNYLFCGYRNRAHDYLYGEQFESMQAQGALKLFTAFSRDQVDKIYVQRLIEEQGEMLWRLIDKEGASIFLSGSAKLMPANVRDAFVQIVKRWGGLSTVAAEAYLSNLDASKRYQKECWS